MPRCCTLASSRGGSSRKPSGPEVSARCCTPTLGLPAAGSSEMLLAICQAYAVLGMKASCWAGSDVREVLALERRGTMDANTSVRFAITVKRERTVPIETSNHDFLEAVAIPAYALAEAYSLEWPYWSLRPSRRRWSM